MTPEFSHHLDRLKDLIAKSGPDRLFAAPLVTPDDTWFPDRWRPNLECVRRILLRLAEYAGLPGLDVEMVAEFDETAETRVPDSVMGQRSKYGRKGMFLGIHEARAWFRAEESHLQSPQHLIGELVREMALTWRQVHDIHVTPHRTEEECADVTAVFLGFGILLCNSAFEPRLEGYRQITWERSSYLYVYDVCELLACWAMLKELPEAEIVKHLGTTQANLFGKAWALWSQDDLRTRFGIPSHSMPEVRVPGGASQREFKPSLAATSAHGTVERLVAAVGEEGGLAAEPIPFAVPVETLPHRRLADWGRLSVAGTWTRMLALVSDAEWDTQAIVLVAPPGSEFRRLALGHVRDRDANDPRQLQQLLTGAFRTESPFRSYLAPGSIGSMQCGDWIPSSSTGGYRTRQRPAAVPSAGGRSSRGLTMWTTSRPLHPCTSWRRGGTRRHHLLQPHHPRHPNHATRSRERRKVDARGSRGSPRGLATRTMCRGAFPDPRTTR